MALGRTAGQSERCHSLAPPVLFPFGASPNLESLLGAGTNRSPPSARLATRLESGAESVTGLEPCVAGNLIVERFLDAEMSSNERCLRAGEQPGSFGRRQILKLRTGSAVMVPRCVGKGRGEIALTMSDRREYKPMPAQKPVPGYQRLIEEIVKTLGRSDVAVEQVSVAGEGILSAAFVRGLRTKRIALPLEQIADRGQVRTAIEEALADFTPRDRDPTGSSATVPEARFQERDRQDRGGAKFD